MFIKVISTRGIVVLLTLCLAACTSYSPLDDHTPVPPVSGSGVKATFLGNTTILISDGETNLLVDGFFSRPHILNTLFGKVGPDPEIIDQELEGLGIAKPGTLDAILVGHAHHDHVLDTLAVAKITNALVMGNKSYRYIHEGGDGKTDPEHLFVVPEDGASKTFGQFTVTYVPSNHVGSHSFVQRLVEGKIQKPLEIPAHFSNFKCGNVFTIHIAHASHGNILVTTTVGAQEGKTKEYQADVVFLAIGLLSKENTGKQDAYWKENVQAVNPKLVIPVHWDNFTRKLSKGLKPTSLLFVDNVEKAMKIVKSKAEAQDRQVRVLNLRESILLRNKKIVQ